MTMSEHGACGGPGGDGGGLGGVGGAHAPTPARAQVAGQRSDTRTLDALIAALLSHKFCHELRSATRDSHVCALLAAVVNGRSAIARKQSHSCGWRPIYTERVETMAGMRSEQGANGGSGGGKGGGGGDDGGDGDGASPGG